MSESVHKHFAVDFAKLFKTKFLPVKYFAKHAKFLITTILSSCFILRKKNYFAKSEVLHHRKVIHVDCVHIYFSPSPPFRDDILLVQQREVVFVFRLDVFCLSKARGPELVRVLNGMLNGSLNNGMLQNGPLQHGSLHNDTALQNGSGYKTVRYRTVQLHKGKHYKTVQSYIQYVTENYGLVRHLL
jgi:hypothetical protein